MHQLGCRGGMPRTAGQDATGASIGAATPSPTSSAPGVEAQRQLHRKEGSCHQIHNARPRPLQVGHLGVLGGWNEGDERPCLQPGRAWWGSCTGCSSTALKPNTTQLFHHSHLRQCAAQPTWKPMLMGSSQVE